MQEEYEAPSEVAKSHSSESYPAEKQRIQSFRQYL
jgi:hypothetical protein